MTEPDANAHEDTHGPPPARNPESLAALLYSEGWQEWTPVAGEFKIPPIVYEILHRPRHCPGAYEVRMFCAATKQMMHEDPHILADLEELRAWWSTETHLELPAGLFAGARADDRDFAVQQAYYAGWNSRTHGAGFPPPNPYTPDGALWRSYYDGMQDATRYMHTDTQPGQ